MDDTGAYYLKVREQVAEADLNAGGPLQVTVVQADTTGTLFSVNTDQSGLIGLMRHLNGRGLLLLSLHREGLVTP